MAIRNIWTIISQEMNHSAASTWVLINIAFPIIGVPLYFFLGQSKLKVYNRRRKKRLNRKPTPFPPQKTNNEVELLVDGKEAFDAIFQAIDQAEHFILVQYYIFRTDRLGLELIDRLSQKSKQGIQIYFLFDNLGSLGITGYQKLQMKKAGIRVARFLPFELRFNLQINFRNHRKCILIDGHTAFVGGMNVGVEYLGVEKHWRDTQVQVRGAACLELAQTFADDWAFAAPARYHIHLERTLADLPRYEGEHRYPVSVYSFGPGDDIERGLYLFMNLIQEAKEQIIIATPYMIPDLILERSLELALVRGVELIIIAPKQTDHRVVQPINNYYLRRLSLKGAKVWQYSTGFMHQKVILVDKYKSLIGTSNFDNRSIYLNFETSLLIEDHDFGIEVDAMLKEDIKNSEELDIEKLSRLDRWVGNFLRLASPIF